MTTTTTERIDWTCPTCGKFVSNARPPVRCGKCQTSSDPAPAPRPARGMEATCRHLGPIVDWSERTGCRGTLVRDPLYHCERRSLTVLRGFGCDKPTGDTCRGCARSGDDWEPLDDSPRYVTTDDLIRDALSLTTRLPPIRRVFGVARSGMIPAAAIACAMSAELWTIDIHSRKIREAGTGFRMGAVAVPDDAPSLIVDDSAYTGRSLEDAAAAVSALDCRPLKCAVYTSPKMTRKLDLFAAVLREHVFEWNVGAAPYSDSLGFDLDGILCRDFTEAEDDDGPRYLETMRSIRPSPIRIRRPASIITARLERYRAETEAWLRRHGHAWRSLDLGPWSSPAERTFEAIVEWKAERIVSRNLSTFVESCPHLALALHQRTGRTVACPATRELHVA
jgi:orotate phosphoribosyltransferase